MNSRIKKSTLTLQTVKLNVCKSENKSPTQRILSLHFTAVLLLVAAKHWQTVDAATDVSLCKCTVQDKLERVRFHLKFISAAHYHGCRRNF
eukprot:3291470-Amphidinium_carterae.1